MQIHQPIKHYLPALIALIVIILSGILFSHIQPTHSFAVTKEGYHYPWFFWLITCPLLALPLIEFIRSNEFQQALWPERVLWLSITMLAISTVHKPRLYIDMQALFYISTVLYMIFHRPFTYNHLHAVHYIILAYLGWNVLSLCWSQCPSYGATLLNRMMPLLLYPACFLFFRLNTATLQRILLAFWQAAMIAIVMTIVCAFYEISAFGFHISDLFNTGKQFFYNADNTIERFAFQMAFAWSGADHPSYNAIWIISALVVTFYLYKAKVLSIWNMAVGIGLILLVIIIIQSRIGIVMSALIIPCGIVYLVENKKRVLYTYAVLGLCAGIYLCINPNLLSDFLNDPTRHTMFQMDYYYLSQQYALGSGIGGMTREHLCSVIPNFPYLLDEHWYPHNQLIGDWMQTGIIGLLLSLALYVSTLVAAIRRRRFTAILFLLCIGLHACIEMPLRFLSGVTMVTLYCCLFLVTLEPAPDTNPDSAACESAN